MLTSSLFPTLNKPNKNQMLTQDAGWRMYQQFCRGRKEQKPNKREIHDHYLQLWWKIDDKWIFKRRKTNTIHKIRPMYGRQV